MSPKRKNTEGETSKSFLKHSPHSLTLQLKKQYVYPVDTFTTVLPETVLPEMALSVEKVHFGRQ